MKFNFDTDNFVIVDFPTEKQLLSFEDDSALKSVLTFFVGRNYSAFEIDGNKASDIIKNCNYTDKMSYCYVDCNGYKVRCKALTIARLSLLTGKFPSIQPTK